VNFSPSIPESGTTTPLASCTFSSTAKSFTMPANANNYNFSFSINGYESQPRVDGRSVPINKT
jgi:hypothetical protein